MIKTNFINITNLLYTGLVQVMNRGTAEILENDEKGIFLRDTVSNVYMLAAKDTEIGINWIDKHEHRNYELLNVFDEKLFRYIKERYQFNHELICYQAVYLHNEIPSFDKKLIIKPAIIEDIDFIFQHYSMLNKNELIKMVEGNNLYVGYENNQIVGFIGQHLEGSMGVLKILPEYRNKGYGTTLETFMIHEMKMNDMIPFCQVEIENEKSLMLQKKLGMHISKEKVYWVF